MLHLAQHSQGCILRFIGKVYRDKKSNLHSNLLHCPVQVYHFIYYYGLLSIDPH